MSPARLEAIAIGREKPAKIHKGRGVKHMVKRHLKKPAKTQ